MFIADFLIFNEPEYEAILVFHKLILICRGYSVVQSRICVRTSQSPIRSHLLMGPIHRAQRPFNVVIVSGSTPRSQNWICRSWRISCLWLCLFGFGRIKSHRRTVSTSYLVTKKATSFCYPIGPFLEMIGINFSWFLHYFLVSYGQMSKWMRSFTSFFRLPFLFVNLQL